jgi:hypothetical protein
MVLVNFAGHSIMEVLRFAMRPNERNGGNVIVVSHDCRKIVADILATRSTLLMR